jgi:two-component system OmpR family response regulator/two-component system response regulator QseB
VPTQSAHAGAGGGRRQADRRWPGGASGRAWPCGDTAGNLATGWAALCAEPFDLLLLDLGLPDGDGASLLARLRAAPAAGLPDAHTPVLVMTARDEVASRIGALDLGADDYVTKPFDLDELAARMRALRRRAAGRGQPLLQHGDRGVDPAARTVQRAGQPVALSAREFAVLLLLLEARPRVLSRTQIEAALYNWDDALGSNAIEVQCTTAKAGRRRDPHAAWRGLCLADGGPRCRAMRRSGPSLFGHLLAWCLGALALLWLSFIVAGYQTGRHETDELVDGHLASVAALLATGGHWQPGTTAHAADVNLPVQHAYQQAMSLVVWDAEGRCWPTAAPLPLFARRGFATCSWAPRRPAQLCALVGRERRGG